MPNAQCPMPNYLDGWSLDDRNPETIKSFMPYWEWFYQNYFRVQSSGWHHIPQSGSVLVVGSHNGGLAAPDMFMVMYDWFRRFGCDRLTYGLMHPQVWTVFPYLAPLAVQCGAIRAHPKMAIAALRREAVVLVYPGGPQDVFRPHSQRDKIYFAGRKGFIKLALTQGVPILPIVSWGAHDTLIVLGEFYEQVRQLHELGMPWLCGIDPVVFPIYLGLPWGLAVGPLPNLPLPAPMKTRVCAPIVFEKQGRAAAKDRKYVDACYEQVQSEMQQALDELIRNGE
ncbi:MAG: acyltransferase family protein [Oscillatoria sp. SIO1A7]|nr:acyltransferase family protein [Oscillatoria sp. SIO1A7]